MITVEYFAGLFDGEGCISIQITDDCPKITASIDMSEPGANVLMEINAQYGGKLSMRMRKYNNRIYPMHSVRWTSADELSDVCDVLIPHLIIKKEQAKLAMWWVNHCLFKRQNLPFGITEARKILIAKMKLMKSNPLVMADDVITEIRKHYSPLRIVS